MQHENGKHGGNVDEIKDFSIVEKTVPNLRPNLSISLPIKPNTCSSQSKIVRIITTHKMNRMRKIHFLKCSRMEIGI